HAPLEGAAQSGNWASTTSGVASSVTWTSSIILAVEKYGLVTAAHPLPRDTKTSPTRPPSSVPRTTHALVGPSAHDSDFCVTCTPRSPNAVLRNDGPLSSRNRSRPCLPSGSARSSTVVEPTGTLVSTSHGSSPHRSAAFSTAVDDRVEEPSSARSARTIRKATAVPSAAIVTTTATTKVTFTERDVDCTA